MLLEFKAKNFKSFKDELVFSMIPAPKQKGLDYSIQKKYIGKKAYTSLSSAVIYGPNAAGKSNIVAAVDVLKNIILRGNIKNTETAPTPNMAAYSLELIPFRTNKKQANTLFEIKFIENNLLFEYILEVDLGRFLQYDYHRKIVLERLLINNHIVMERTSNNLLVEPCKNIKGINQYFNNSVFNNIDEVVDIAIGGLDQEELFLMNGFKTIFAKQLVSMISSWFENELIVLYHSDRVKATPHLLEKKEDAIYVEKTLTQAAKIFGISSNALGYKIVNDTPTLVSLFQESKKGGTAIPAEIYESFGTLRFVREFPVIIEAIAKGATLVVDEFDASIHPMALMNIINIFHNDDVNRTQAQLIFNTHNPIFLSSGLFRRDEIHFVERSDLNGSSHYTLADFKTVGDKAVRNGADYMKNYFVNQYGAIRDIDFTPVINSLFEEEADDD
ncbi:MAG: ATP-binding protein [Clostridiales bacterium]|nr:ATP-binding protein [Clostridiales bacterium]